MDEDTPFSESAAENQIDEARAQVGTPRFPGMSYEEGVVAALEWVLGHRDEIPYPEH